MERFWGRSNKIKIHYGTGQWWPRPLNSAPGWQTQVSEFKTRLLYRGSCRTARKTVSKQNKNS